MLDIVLSISRKMFIKFTVEHCKIFNLQKVYGLKKSQTFQNGKYKPFGCFTR